MSWLPFLADMTSLACNTRKVATQTHGLCLWVLVFSSYLS